MADVLRKDIFTKVDNANDQFAGVITKTEKAIFDSAVALIKKLDVDANGYIKPTTANIKMLADIKTKLSKIATNKEYLSGVKELAKSFDEIYRAQVKYYSSQFAQKTMSDAAKNKFAAMQRIAVMNTIDGLTGAGLQTNVTDELSKMLLKAVTSGEKYSDLVSAFKSKLISSKDGQSSLAKYAGTYATTALTQYAGQNNRLFTDDLGCEWFEYVGSEIETTREFCSYMLEKQYIHVSEIPEILDGRIDVNGTIKKCEMNPKTGLPKGMIEGTNAENFQINVGGWNCRHQLVPIAKEAVPAYIRERIENGSLEEKNTYEKTEWERWYEDNKSWLDYYQNEAEKTGVSLLPLYDKNATYEELNNMMFKLQNQMETKHEEWKDAYYLLDNFVLKATDAKAYDIASRSRQELLKYEWKFVKNDAMRIQQILSMKKSVAKFEKELKEFLNPKVATGTLSQSLQNVKLRKVDFLKVEKAKKEMSEAEIVDHLGGGDMTRGSCSSLAFAYAGQRNGFDVLDFRDGESRHFFSQNPNIREIVNSAGGTVTKNTSDFKAAEEALKIVEVGKEYYFACAKHAAIIRKTDHGFEYLELQSASKSEQFKNGFHPLTKEILRYRFDAKRQHSVAGWKYESECYIVSVEDLGKCKDFRELLGYINTDPSQQHKSIYGTIK